MRGALQWGVESRAGVFPCLMTAAHKGTLLLRGLSVGYYGVLEAAEPLMEAGA